jgi:hypothetical protein
MNGFCKSHGIWISEGNRFAPLIYFKKPAWIKDEETWKRIIKSIRISLPHDIEIQ